jgi:hypothetical protein
MRRMKDQRADDRIYDFAVETPSPVKSGVARAQPKPASTSPLAYRSKKAEAALTADPETIKNLYMPMWLLGGGVVIEIAAAFLHGGGAADAMLDVGIELILGTAVMLAGILLAAKLRHIDLGRFWIAAFKLSAIAVAPAAVGDLVWPILRFIPLVGGLIGFAVEFVLYFALLGALFDLEESDTWFCVWVIFLVRLAVYFTLLAVRAHMG